MMSEDELKEILIKGPARHFLESGKHRISQILYQLKPSTTTPREIIGVLDQYEIDGVQVLAFRAGDSWENYGKNADIVTQDTIVVYRDPKVCALIDISSSEEIIIIKSPYQLDIKQALADKGLIQDNAPDL